MLIDLLIQNTRLIDNKWVVARPLVDTRWKFRIVAAWKVLTGKMEAVSFYKQ